jgi:hypothetical protein
MKKVFLTMMAVCLAMGARAVDLPKQGLGIQLGWARPTLRVNDPNAKDSLSHHIPLNGFKAGLVYDASYIAGFGSTIGINYTFAGGHTTWAKDGISFSKRTQTLYQEVELFVDWQYKFEVAKETYLMLYTGPTLQCGLALNMNVFKRNDMTDEIERTSYSAYTTDEKNDHFRRLNITWGVGAGFQYKRYFLRGGYDFGLINPYAEKQFVDALGNTLDIYTRGRFDQWSIKIGVYLWYAD